LKESGLSEFEVSVLLEVATLRPGEVVSYAEIARRIGRPSAARAVGNALAKNPFPIIIPCHRVIRSDGRLGGYSGRGGMERKRELLAREGYRFSARAWR